MLSREKTVELLKRAIELSEDAVKNGNTPFAALLVDKDGNILLEQENNQISENSIMGHAENALIQKAGKLYSKDFLWNCTIIASAEPCAMCSGAIFWSNIGNVAFAMSEKKLRDIIEDKNSPNFDLPCAEVISRGNKDIKVTGPYEEVEDLAASIHEEYWNKN